LRLINKTDFYSRQLKAFIRKIAVDECMSPEEIRELRVKAYYRKRSRLWQDNYVTGYAYYGSTMFGKIELGFVKGVMPDKVQMAKTTAHELAHTQGVRHGVAMRNNIYGWKDGWRERWAWAAEIPLELKPLKEKPDKKDVRTDKMNHCEKMVALWARKVKLARTKQQKWERKLRYHEKRDKMAAIQPDPAIQEKI
jgi:hypothetical protein